MRIWNEDATFESWAGSVEVRFKLRRDRGRLGPRIGKQYIWHDGTDGGLYEAHPEWTFSSRIVNIG